MTQHPYDVHQKVVGVGIGHPNLQDSAELCGKKENLRTVALCCLKEAKRNEHKLLHTSNLSSVSLLTISAITLFGTATWLRGVLVPLVLALYLLFLLEPIMLLLMNPAMLCASCSPFARRVAFKADTQRRCALDSTSCKNSKSSMVPTRSLHAFWTFRATMAIAACIILVTTFVAGSAFLIIQSFASLDWRKYAESPKLRRLLLGIQNLGANTANLEQDIDWGVVLQYLLKGPLMDIFDMTLSMMGTLFLTVLFLVFLLMANVGHDYYELDSRWKANAVERKHGLGWRARSTVQRYIAIATIMSISVGLLVWFVLSQLKVDLAFCFAFLSFLLHFIPHFGYMVAILAPLPFVFLDPSKTWADFFACIIWPTLIHHIFSSFVEPKLLSKTLNLHPVTVLVGLAFWTVCWGPVGAVLSAPLTCIFRLVMIDMDHPYTNFIAHVMEGRVISNSFLRKDDSTCSSETTDGVTASSPSQRAWNLVSIHASAKKPNLQEQVPERKESYEEDSLLGEMHGAPTVVSCSCRRNPKTEPPSCLSQIADGAQKGPEGRSIPSPECIGRSSCETNNPTEGNVAASFFNMQSRQRSHKSKTPEYQ